MSVGEIDPNSADLTQIKDTRLIGMAASLATTIRGQDVVHDATALEKIAADQLDVDVFAFPKIISILEESGWIDDVKRKGDKVLSFTESIPFHESIYEGLGDSWTSRDPDEFEQSYVAIIDRLAVGPLPEEDLSAKLGIGKTDSARLLSLATDSDMVKSIATTDGSVLYSPFFFFGNADELGVVLENYGPGQLQEELGRVKKYQGLPVDESSAPAVTDAIRRGLIIAPSVEDPQHLERSFACLPYSVDRSYLHAKRSILEKALAVVACIRCGEHFGGATSIHSPLALLDALLDPNRTIKPHSSATRQYQTLFRLQVIDFDYHGMWAAPKLIRTSDNVEALTLARDLIAYGEPLASRTKSADEAQALLLNQSRYKSPIETVHAKRKTKVHLSDRDYAAAIRAVMGQAAL